MRDDVAEKSGRWLRCLAVGLSVFFVVIFLYISLRRMVYPFQMERIELSMMTTVWRLRHGYPLYGPPSLEWASFLYAPLFFWLSAALSKVMGVSYAPLRAVSILSTLGSFGVIYAMVWKETRRVSAGIVAVGLFVSLYLIVFGWFDFGRVDSLSVCLFLLAVYATRWKHPMVAAFFWLLACAAKQTYLPLGIAVFAVEWARPRRMLAGMATLAAMVWAGDVLLNRATHQWFNYYIFGTTGELSWVPWRLAVLSLPTELLRVMPIAIGVIGAAILYYPMRWRDRDGSFYAIVTVLLGGAIWFVLAHRGANINAVIPMFAWVSVLFGLAVHRLLKSADGEEIPQHWRHVIAAAVWLAVSIQLAAHLYTPGMFLGVIKDGPARQRFQDRVRATPGDVWLVNHSYDAMQAGKPMHADMDAYDAVLGRRHTPAMNELQDAIRSRKFSAIVLDRDPKEYGPPGLFTGPPVSEFYPLLVRYQEEAWSEAPDKPMYVMLPCAALTSPPVGLIDAQHGFVDRSRCP
jgi:hypothetical protein